MDDASLYPVVVQHLHADDGGGFIAYALDLQGCMSDGETQEEAIANLRDAILEWCDETRRLGRDVPAPGSCFNAAKQHDQVTSKLVKAQKDLIDCQCKILEEQDQMLSALRTQVANLSADVGQDGGDGDSSWASQILSGRRLTSPPPAKKLTHEMAH